MFDFLFPSHAFGSQTLRLVAEAQQGGGDVFDIARCCREIDEGDTESWERGWVARAGRIEGLARDALADGRNTTAMKYFFHANQYWRMADVFLGEDRAADRADRFSRAQACFRAAAKLHSPRIEAIEVVCGADTYDGYFCHPVDPAPGAKWPAVFFIGGADAYAEEISWRLSRRGRSMARVARDERATRRRIRQRDLRFCLLHSVADPCYRGGPRAAPVEGCRMTERIALLGWGSLLWDEDEEFDDLHGRWRYDGPALKLEFSRISKSRGGALTLVIDPENGKDTQVRWSLSRRPGVGDAMDDLKKREKTRRKNIGMYSVTGDRRGRDEHALSAIGDWAGKRGLDGVVWTDLPSNFEGETGKRFSADAAIRYLKTLRGDDREKAFRYIENAPAFVRTPLRSAFVDMLEGVRG